MKIISNKRQRPLLNVSGKQFDLQEVCCVWLEGKLLNHSEA